MKSQRNIARQLLGLTLTLVGLMCWNTLPVNLSERAVQAATRTRATEPTGQVVSRVVTNGRVAFVSSEGNAQSDIYTMNPDGSDRKQVTFSQDYEDQPAWSPDGTKIAFASLHLTGNGGYNEIFVMNADGSDQRRLTQSKYDRFPTWSPDGTQIAFWRIDSITMPSSWGIFVMNADGSDQRAVASTSEWHEPAWSPDGLKLAVGNLYTIYLINVDGSNRTLITQPPPNFEDHSPAWSPDGTKITFARCVDSNGFGCYTTSHLWVVNADGSNPKKLTDTLAYTHTWSPDGTKIIFGSVDDSLEPRDLFVMNPDGSGLTNITNTDGTRERSPSWQPLLLAPGVNPIDDPQFFVRQHYLDFLGREPDPAGFAFWTNEITACGTDVGCTEGKRINVSAAFFLSIEFQTTGYLVERMYKAAYGDSTDAPTGLAVPVVRSAELVADSALVGQGVVVNSPGWEQQLEANKRAYALAFVQRQRFTDAYPTSMAPAAFVAKLNENTGGALTQAEVDALVAELSADQTAEGRASVLRKVAENTEVGRREQNRAFVLMQYFGYLRRDAEAAPDTNHAGYHFWLQKLERFQGNYVEAEMVKAFISSTEYRARFGPS
jgi:Tol biopolymer transport system component